MDAFLELKIFKNNCSTMLRMHFQPIEQCHMTMRTVIYMTFFITVFFHHSMHQIYHVLTYITVRNMVYIYIQCLNFLLYRGGVFSSRDNGSYRTCCTNGLGMYTPPRASPVISVLYGS